MTERPILFSAPMVRALLAGTKTQTRREVKITHRTPGLAACLMPPSGLPTRPAVAAELCPYGQPGDRLWVRESLGYDCEFGHYFAADRKFLCELFDDEEAETGPSYDDRMPDRAIPSIHLPRRYSRILLEIASVRVTRLQHMSAADAMAEGIVRLRDGGYGLPAGEHYHSADPRESFWSLWESINGPGSVQANPWLWVLEFKRVEVRHG